MSKIQRMILLLSLLCVVYAARAFGRAEKEVNPNASRDSKPLLTIGLFIGRLEVGERIFTPCRFLPFDHPDSLGHEFPTVLRFHEREFETLVHLGEQVGLKLRATLLRYPQWPGSEWKYTDFALPPVDAVKLAPITRRTPDQSPIKGLAAVAFVDGHPLAFIIDTRHLSLAERGMKRATTSGVDMSRAEMLAGFERIADDLPPHGTHIVVFQAKKGQTTISNR